MNHGVHALLGLLALGSLVQALFYVWLAAMAYRTDRRLSALQGRAGARYRPALEAVRRTQANLSRLRLLAGHQRRRLRDMRADALRPWREITHFLGRSGTAIGD